MSVTHTHTHTHSLTHTPSQDYSVSQTTLDDVFIHFANEQSEEAGLAITQEQETRPLIKKGQPQEVDIELSVRKSSPDLVVNTV